MKIQEGNGTGGDREWVAKGADQVSGGGGIGLQFHISVIYLFFCGCSTKMVEDHCLRLP